MRTRGLLPVLVAGALAGLAASGASASTPPAAYAWAQPWTAARTVPCGQLPVWIAIAFAPPAHATVAPGSSYRWVQPGTASRGVPCGDPPAA